MTNTVKLNKVTSSLWTAKLAGESANIVRTSRGQYVVTYLNSQGVATDTEVMRDSLAGVALRLADRSI